VERACILDGGRATREGLTNAEISRKRGMPKSFRELHFKNLETRSYLRREAQNGTICLGLRILSLGGYAQRPGHRRRGTAVLRALLERIGI